MLQLCGASNQANDRPRARSSPLTAHLWPRWLASSQEPQGLWTADCRDDNLLAATRQCSWRYSAQKRSARAAEAVRTAALKVAVRRSRSWRSTPRATPMSRKRSASPIESCVEKGQARLRAHPGCGPGTRVLWIRADRARACARMYVPRWKRASASTSGGSEFIPDRKRTHRRDP